jgi:hypothetical protein
MADTRRQILVRRIGLGGPVHHGTRGPPARARTAMSLAGRSGLGIWSRVIAARRGQRVTEQGDGVPSRASRRAPRPSGNSEGGPHRSTCSIDRLLSWSQIDRQQLVRAPRYSEGRARVRSEKSGKVHLIELARRDSVAAQDSRTSSAPEAAVTGATRGQCRLDGSHLAHRVRPRGRHADHTFLSGISFHRAITARLPLMQAHDVSPGPTRAVHYEGITFHDGERLV